MLPSDVSRRDAWLKEGQNAQVDSIEHRGDLFRCSGTSIPGGKAATGYLWIEIADLGRGNFA
jgi:hypothetical protein